MKRIVNLKRILLISIVSVICIGLLYIITITDHEGISVGMSYDEVCDLLGNKISFKYYNYIFLTNKWGNPIIVEFNYNDYLARKIRCYSSLWTSTSPHAFEQIEKGMSIFEVTSRVGLPFGSTTFGMNSLSYYDTSGNECRIYLTYDEDYSFYVQSVKIYGT